MADLFVAAIKTALVITSTGLSISATELQKKIKGIYNQYKS
jgi:hypothetical protein